MAIFCNADPGLVLHSSGNRDNHNFNRDQLPSVRSVGSRVAGLLPLGRPAQSASVIARPRCAAQTDSVQEVGDAMSVKEDFASPVGRYRRSPEFLFVQLT